MLRKKQIKYITYFLILLYVCAFFLPIKTYALDTKIAEIAKEINESNLDIKNSDVVIEDNGKYYAVDGKKLFAVLKETYKDESYALNPDLTWGEVDSRLDNLDASVFSSSVGVSGGFVMFVMRHTAVKILTVSSAEQNIILAYYKTLMIPIGMTLCLMYGLGDLADKRFRELTSLQNILQSIVKIIIGMACVQYSDIVLKFMYDLSNSFLQIFVDVQSDAVANAVSITNLVQIAMECDMNNTIESIANICSGSMNALFGTVLSSIITLIISVMCYARKLELGLRSLFIPIGLANISNAGWRGMGFIKKTGAAALQAGLIVFVIYFAGKLSTGVNAVGLSGICVPISCIATTATAKKIAEEAMQG